MTPLRDGPVVGGGIDGSRSKPISGLVRPLRKLFREPGPPRPVPPSRFPNTIPWQPNHATTYDPPMHALQDTSIEVDGPHHFVSVDHAVEPWQTSWSASQTVDPQPAFFPNRLERMSTWDPRTTHADLSAQTADPPTRGWAKKFLSPFTRTRAEQVKGYPLLDTVDGQHRALAREPVPIPLVRSTPVRRMNRSPKRKPPPKTPSPEPGIADWGVGREAQERSTLPPVSQPIVPASAQPDPYLPEEQSFSRSTWVQSTDLGLLDRDAMSIPLPPPLHFPQYPAAGQETHGFEHSAAWQTEECQDAVEASSSTYDHHTPQQDWYWTQEVVKEKVGDWMARTPNAKSPQSHAMVRDGPAVREGYVLPSLPQDLRIKPREDVLRGNSRATCDSPVDPLQLTKRLTELQEQEQALRRKAYRPSRQDVTGLGLVFTDGKGPDARPGALETGSRRQKEGVGTQARMSTHDRPPLRKPASRNVVDSHPRPTVPTKALPAIDERQSLTEQECLEVTTNNISERGVIGAETISETELDLQERVETWRTRVAIMPTKRLYAPSASATAPSTMPGMDQLGAVGDKRASQLTSVSRRVMCAAGVNDTTPNGGKSGVKTVGGKCNEGQVNVQASTARPLLQVEPVSSSTSPEESHGTARISFQGSPSELVRFFQGSMSLSQGRSDGQPVPPLVGEQRLLHVDQPTASATTDGSITPLPLGTHHIRALSDSDSKRLMALFEEQCGKTADPATLRQAPVANKALPDQLCPQSIASQQAELAELTELLSEATSKPILDTDPGVDQQRIWSTLHQVDAEAMSEVEKLLGQQSQPIRTLLRKHPRLLLSIALHARPDDSAGTNGQGTPTAGSAPYSAVQSSLARHSTSVDTLNGNTWQREDTLPSAPSRLELERALRMIGDYLGGVGEISQLQRTLISLHRQLLERAQDVDQRSAIVRRIATLERAVFNSGTGNGDDQGQAKEGEGR